MYVIVDDKIPYIRETIKALADRVEFMSGKEMTKERVKDADALIIRTRTHCDRELLEDSHVRFIASATMGFDHIDTDYCEKKGIKWTNCPGCNASSVGQYDRTVLYRMAKDGKLRLKDTVLGIVGVGNAGSAVAREAEKLGLKDILFNDPPRQETGKPGEGTVCAYSVLRWSSLKELAECCDVIAFHTPLLYKGEHPTFHLADEAFFRSLRKHPVILNAGRGGVVDEDALLRSMDEGLVSDAVIDTWEKEPSINRELLDRVYMGTPHVAGYSADGKANATRMALEAFCRFFGLKANIQIHPPVMTEADYWDKEDRELWLYDPMKDSERLKSAPGRFEYLRGNYPLRREKTE